MEKKSAKSPERLPVTNTVTVHDATYALLEALPLSVQLWEILQYQRYVHCGAHDLS